MSLVERVARELSREAGESDWEAFLPQARNVIRVMREPTDHMLSDRTIRASGYAGDVDDVWRRMIDAALSET